MKKKLLAVMLSGLLLTGCGSAADNQSANTIPAETLNKVEEKQDAAAVISPMQDDTMDNLTDAILSVSLEESGVYVDDNGSLQMELKIYTYDKYDMADISNLKVGDTFVTHAGEMKISTLSNSDYGTVLINGGLEEGGIELASDETGIFYETGFSDMKNWYEVGKETIRVSADFQGTDSADLEKGDVIFYPGDFLVGAVTNYNFTPYNTTIRVENGQVVELTRVYTP